MSVVASGTYRYWHEGCLQAITEPWQLQHTAQGLHLYGQRVVDGRTVLALEARYENATCIAMQMQWHMPSRSLGAHYALRDSHLQWQRDGDAAMHTLALPEGSRLFPLLRAATGPLLRQLQATPCTVVVPCIRDASDPAFLSPLRSERQALLVSDEQQHYRYLGGEYGPTGCECWLDEHGLLHRYRWASPQGEWLVQLEALQIAAGFSGFSASARSSPGTAS